MPRTFLFSLALFLGSAVWGFVPPLVFLLTGRRMEMTGGGAGQVFSSLWIQAGLLVFLGACWGLLFGKNSLGKRPEEDRFAAGFSILFIYLAYLLQGFMVEISGSQDRAVFFEKYAWIYLAAGVAFLFMLLKPPKQSGWILGTVLVFLAVWTPVVVKSFPLDHGFSDVLLSVQQSCRDLLHGISPYGLEGERKWIGGSNYFPGLWLSYLPAIALNLDPRYMGSLYMAGFALLVWRGMEAPNRNSAAWFITLFLLNPWALFHCDTYIPAYLFSWGLFFFSLCRKKDRLVPVWFGLGLSMHLFSWALTPLWVVWMKKRQGFQGALNSLFVAVVIAALVLLPFVFWNPGGFYQGTLHYFFINPFSTAVAHFGFGVWLGQWRGVLMALAVLFLGLGVWGAALEKASLESLFRWLAVSLGLGFLASYHVQPYFYFVPLAFLLLHEAVLLGNEKNGSISALYP